MNHFRFHIGDYLKDAAHLSLLEHGVYLRLMQVYYTREEPIPEDQAARLIGARSQDERDALAAVIREFFKVVDGNCHQNRCQGEIDEWRRLSAEQAAKGRAGAAKRWSAPKHSNGHNRDLATVTELHGSGHAAAKNLDGRTIASNSQLPTTNKTPEVQEGETEGNGRQAPPPKASRARLAKPVKVPIPDGFTLDAELAAYVTAKIPDANPVAMFESFCGDARAKGWAYVDWRQAWQTYVRNCAPNSGHWAAGQYPKAGPAGVRWM